jgi:hypothetical protein
LQWQSVNAGSHWRGIATLLGVTASFAQALQRSKCERLKIVELVDVIGGKRRSSFTKAQAFPTQWFTSELISRSASPCLRAVPLAWLHRVRISLRWHSVPTIYRFVQVTFTGFFEDSPDSYVTVIEIFN